MGPLTKLTMAVVGATGMLVTLAGPAVAQDSVAGGGPASSRPIELSIGGSGALTWLTSGGALRVSVIIPVSERRSIELFGGPYRPSHADAFIGDIRAFYGFQSVRRIERLRRPGLDAFFVLGAEGAFLREPTYTGCYGPNCVRQSRVSAVPPIVLTYGVGAQKTLSPRFALRVEADVMTALFIPLGVRAGVSLSTPLGQVYRTAKKVAR